MQIRLEMIRSKPTIMPIIYFWASFRYGFGTTFWNDCRHGRKRGLSSIIKAHRKSVYAMFSAKSLYSPWEKAFHFATIMRHVLRYFCGRQSSSDYVCSHFRIQVQSHIYILLKASVIVILASLGLMIDACLGDKYSFQKNGCFFCFSSFTISVLILKEAEETQFALKFSVFGLSDNKNEKMNCF